jgi:hypothetical protein
MRNTFTVIFVAASLIIGRVPVFAHHAFAAEFDDRKPISLRGTVTKWELTNPHSWIHLEVKDKDGNVTAWMIEGGSPNALFQNGFTKASLPSGTEIIVRGFEAKAGGNRGVGTSLTYPDRRKLFLGGSAPGANGPNSVSNDPSN